MPSRTATSPGGCRQWAGLLDEYLVAYVGGVKGTYGLSVDEAERDALLEAAVELGLCEADSPGGSGGNGSGGRWNWWQ